MYVGIWLYFIIIDVHRDALKTSKAEMIFTLFKLFKLKELSEVWKRYVCTYVHMLCYNVATYVPLVFNCLVCTGVLVHVNCVHIFYVQLY